MATLPYNPTVLLNSDKHRDVVYIIDNNDHSNVRLRGLNTSSSLSSTNLSFVSIDGDVPFGGTDGTSYSAFISDNGTIYALAGKCSDGANGAAAWAFAPDVDDALSGSWAQSVITVDETGNTTAGGSNYLAAGLAFSSNLNATADMYVFGGMCPQSSKQSVETWQSSALYSNSLLHLEQSQTSGASAYTLETVGARGPPIPEAGFSLTPLSPTYFNATTGNITIQQNFVLLGGHTQLAFINMSQVAVLSLPEQTWAFLPVAQPKSTKRSPTSIDPRSGHTAVLSEDGTSIVLLGGWVGDVNTPADPQLAILEVGEGYGGAAEWQWTVPSASGTGPASNGIYGHGAVMLPGNVLMVAGGTTVGSGSGELARRTTPDAYFFNVTSKSWLASYKNPTWDVRQQATASGENDSTKIGLGAGLGIGLAVLLAIIVALFFCSRKKRQQRKIADNDLRALALGNEQLRSPSMGFGGIDGRGGDFAAGSPYESHGSNAYPWAPTLSSTRQPNQARPGQYQPNEAERTGLLVEIPSPTRGLRRSLHSRGSHWYEDGRRSRGSSYIHPIAERDEDEMVHGPSAQHHGEEEMAQLGDASLIPLPLSRPTSRPLSDPFRDPPMMERSLLDGSRSPSPQLLLATADPGIAESDAAAADTNHLAGGDTNDASLGSQLASDINDNERTSSTLSTHSMVSALSQQPSSSGSGGVSLSRDPSQRSAALFSTRALAPSTNPTVLSEGESMVMGYLSDPTPGDSLYQHHSSATINATPLLINRRPLPLGSHPPAHRVSAALQPGTGSSPSSFAQLQAEGPDLLMKSANNTPERARHQYASSTVEVESSRAREDENNFDAEPLSSRRRPANSRPRSWMGSMRRALVTSASVASHSSGRSTPSPVQRSGNGSPRRDTLFNGSADVHGGPLGIRTSESEGNDVAGPAAPPRATTWGPQRQQGSRAWAPHDATTDSSPIGDWGAPALASAPARASSASPRIDREDDVDTDEGDWDVESAVERRVVQLMFTVPREKLRVVNRGTDEGDAVSVKSARSLKHASSVRSGRNVHRTVQGYEALSASPAAGDEPPLGPAHSDSAGPYAPLPTTDAAGPATGPNDAALVYLPDAAPATAASTVVQRQPTLVHRVPRGPLAESNYVVYDGSDDEENVVVHGGTDDEDDEDDEDNKDNEDNEDDENVVVHAEDTDDEDACLAAHGPGTDDEGQDGGGTLPRWRKLRDVAVERLRAASGEEAVEKVRAASGESAASARA